ncbi:MULTISPECIES: lysozyme [Sphingomonadales]|uniref:lysozyme n=1 Tax=Sphingomonadales TaxID=204457 RepID=UPI000824AF61|nr:MULTISPECIES: lysozyme [Sphingomonadales]
MSEQKPQSRKGVAAVIGTAAAAILIPLVAQWEGKSNDPYRDIVGVWTVCYGETKAPMRRYSDAECKAMLDSSLAGYAAPVLRCTPTIRNRPGVVAAATSLAYNVGTPTYCRSTAARRFNAGDIAGGCQALTWFNKAGGRRVQGLVNRRQAEYRICIKDAGAPLIRAGGK